MDDTKHEDESAQNLVQVNIVIKRKDSAKAIVPEDGDGVSEDQHDDNDGQGQDVLASCS